MKLRHALSVFFCLTLSLSVFAAEPAFEAGQHYKLLANPVVNSDSDKVEVIEFFSYGCPYCYKLEPTVEKWLASKANNIDFKRAPVVFHKEWQVYARAYYIAQAFELLPQFNVAVFAALHEEKQSLGSEKAMQAFFVQQGIQAKDFTTAYERSPLIDARMAEGKRLALQYRISQVPSFVIAGKYLTDVSMVGGDNEKLMQVVDYLVRETP